MRLRLVTWGLIACLAVADLAGAVWLWVLWQERGRPPAGHGASPHLLGAGPAQAPPAKATTAQAPPAELNVACMLAVQAQMSASRQRSACP